MKEDIPKTRDLVLSHFLSVTTGVNISPDLIGKWSNYMINVNEVIHPGVVEVLDYLNNKGIENVIYSNAFTNTQVGRLKKVGLDSYFKRNYRSGRIYETNERGIS